MAPKIGQNDNIKTLSRLKSEVPEGWNTPMIISELPIFPSDVNLSLQYKGENQ